jgi:hypothetical protein
MFPFFPVMLATEMVEVDSLARSREFITEYQEIRPLPGQFDEVSVFNSNSPEVVKTEGILLSTFPNSGKTDPSAHLNQALQGRFNFFSHHISRPLEKRTLYQGVIVHNPTSAPVTLKVLQGASYLTSPDAPFIDLPPMVEDPFGEVFSGPGSRLVNTILRGVHHSYFPREIVLPPHTNQMLFSLPIRTSSARSTLLRLESDGAVYMANLAMYAVPEVPEPEPTEDEKKATPLAQPIFRAPTLAEWRYLLSKGTLVKPRDVSPLEPGSEQTVYGRVAGVSIGATWTANIVDTPGSPNLTIPEPGKAFSYPLSSTDTGTHGTKQVQSAPLIVRYPDTALRSHGNYTADYDLTLPLFNNTDQAQAVTVSIQTPLKQDRYADRLFFVEPPESPIFFRGTVRVDYRDQSGRTQAKYFHLVQRQGQQGEPLVALNLDPGERQNVRVTFLYPPDATPPQVLTIETE